MSELPEERIADLERRVEDLRRANEGLGRELIERAAGRRPRSASTAARSVAKLTNARDRAEAALRELEGEAAGLRYENKALRAEVHRLRGGRAGALRRVRARILGR